MSVEAKLGTDASGELRENVTRAAQSMASTPGSERSEDEGGLVGNTTVTTELISNRTDKKVKEETFTVTHTGIRGE
jgi:hypothetical protein